MINSSSPYGNQSGQESLDFVLAASNFAQDISLFFVDDGVFQLIEKQTPEQIEHKNFPKTFAALGFYDVENIYVCAESLTLRNLSYEALCIESTLVSDSELRTLLSECDTLLRFG